MTKAIGPDRVLVISVGIEKYAYGDELSLPGAGTAAGRFASWALANGVPPTNVWLARTLLPDSPQLPADLTEDEQAAFAACKKMGTTQTDFEDLFAQEVSTVDADVLLFYWCGHGVLDTNGHRSLFTSDFYEQMRRCVAIDSMLRFLSSNMVQGLEHQVCVIDACANAVEHLNWPQRLAPATFPHGNPRGEGVEQYSLFSASEGKIAGYDHVARRSDFSEAIFEWLKKHPLEWPSDLPEFMAGMAEYVIREFTQRRDDGMTDQTPAMRIFKGPEGPHKEIPIADGMPVDPRTRKRLDQQLGMTPGQIRRATEAVRSLLVPDLLPSARDEIVDLLSDSAETKLQGATLANLMERVFREKKTQDLCDLLSQRAATRHQHQAVEDACAILKRQDRISEINQQLIHITTRQMKEAFSWAVAAPDDLPPEDLDSTLDRLTEYGEIHGVEPLTRFVVYLEHIWKQEIKDHARYLPHNLKNDLRKEIDRAQNDRARLVIEVRNGESGKHFAWPQEITAFRHTPGKDWVRQDEKVHGDPRTLADVQDAVHRLLTDIKDHYMSSFTLGFMMTREAFDELPEEWTHGSAYVEDRALWRDHPTMLHSLEQLTVDSFKTTLKEHLRNRDRFGKRNEEANMVWIEPDPDLLGKLRAAIGNPEAPRALCGLTFLPDKVHGELKQDPIIAALTCGVQFLLWPWNEEDLATWPATKKRVEEILGQCRFEDLPMSIHQARLDGTKVRLIWNDLDVLPHQEYLPGMGGGAHNG